MKIERKQKFSFEALQEKEVKSLAVLDLVRKKTDISRKDIAENTGIKIVSVAHYVKDYIREKLILEGGIDVSTGGRKPELFQLNIADNFVVGMEITVGSVRAALMDIGLSCAGDSRIEKKYTSGSGIVEICGNIVEELIKKSNIPPEKIKALGIGISENIPQSVIDGLGDKTGLDVYYCDSPTCAAFGEKYLNNSVSAKDLLYIHSDLGMGVILQGENLKALTAEESKYLRPWHKNMGIREMAKREVARGVGIRIASVAEGKIENITNDVVIEAAREQDEVAANIIYGAGVNLGLRVSYLVNLFGPQAVILGGGLEKAGGLMLDPIKKIMEKLALKSRMNATKIIMCKLKDDAVSSGAAALAVREIFLRA